MKKTTKKIFNKFSIFLGKIKNSLSFYFKKYPKTLGFFLLVLLITPTISFAIDWDKLSIGGVAASFALWVTNMLKTLTGIIVYAAGLLFDNMFIITLSPDMYNSDWIKLGWSLIRDVANIAFILGVVIIGFFMIMGKTEWQRMLLNLVIIVFIMNFSMFFGRVIIDAGNFTSAIFYSMASVEVTYEKNDDGIKDDSITFATLGDKRYLLAAAVLGKRDGNSIDYKWRPYFGDRSIATGLIAFVNPTKIYTEEYFKDIIKKDTGKSDTDIKLALIILNVVFILTMVAMASAFVRASFMFMSRTIHLIKWIIAAPVYFAWYFLPGGDKRLYEWFGEISNKAFCTVSYMVGMWLIFLFLSSDTMGLINNMDHVGLVSLIVMVIVKAFLIFESLNKLTEMGTEHCNDGEKYGEKLAGFAKSATAFVGGGFVKGGARSTLGIAGRRLRHGGLTKSLVQSENFIARGFGEKLHQWGSTLNEVKINGKSFKDKVDENNKIDAGVNSSLSETERRRRSVAKTNKGIFAFGEDKKKFDDVMVQEKYDNEDGSELKDKDFEHLEQKVSNMRDAGYNDHEIEKVRNKEIKRILKKEESGGYQTEARDVTTEKNIHLLKDKQSMLSTVAEKIAGEKVGKGVTVFEKILGGATRIAVGKTDEAESERQFIEKKKLEAKIGADKKAEKNKQKKTREEYKKHKRELNDKKDEEDKILDNAKKELNVQKDMDKSLGHLISIMDADRDRVETVEHRASLETLKRQVENGETVDINTAFGVLKGSAYRDDISGMEDEVIEYKDKKSKKDAYTIGLEKLKKGLSKDETELQRLEKGLLEEKDDESPEYTRRRNERYDEWSNKHKKIQKNKERMVKNENAIAEIDKVMGKTEAKMDNLMRSKASEIKNHYSQEQDTIQAEKEADIKTAQDKIDNLAKEEKEIAENIGKGDSIDDGVNKRTTVSNTNI